MTYTFPALTPEQNSALEAYGNANGKGWREALSDAWMNCTEPMSHKAALRQVRNTFGPTWLHDVYAWGWLPECPAWRPLENRDAPKGDAEGLPQWSAAFAPPAVGARVRVRMNGLGLATVTGYFIEAGYLGVIVKLDEPKDWYVKQNGGNVPGHSFGAEIELV